MKEIVVGIEETQKTGAAAQQAAAAAAERMQKTELRKMAQEIDKSRKSSESFTQLMDKSASDRGMGILSQAVATFAKSSIGKMFLKERDIIRDLERKDLFKNPENNPDQVTLSKNTIIPHIANTAKRREVARELQEMYQKIDLETKGMLKEYSQIYAKVITTSSGVAANELDKMERKLKDKGVTNNQLYELKLMIKNSIRGGLVSQIKEAFLRKMVSTDQVVELGVATRGLNDILETITGNEEIGGTNFGNYRAGLQGTVDHIQDELSRELRLALKDLMDQAMTKRLVAKSVDPEEVKQELKDFLQFAARIGFNTKEYLQTWSKSFINEGLFPFEEPDKPSIMGQNMSGKQDQQNEEPEQPEEITEDYLIASLRAGYMRIALGGGWRSSLFAQYKIRQVKNKMIKLGIYYDELNEKIKKEAELIAAAKIMEMLKEALLERGTLYKLAGPAYKMIDAKITGLMRNAEKLKMNISEYDFNNLRDNANQIVFDISKRELHLTMVSLNVQETPPMRDKKNKLVILLSRLKAESNIQEEIGFSNDQLKDKIRISR